jgi:hypothetical protein
MPFLGNGVPSFGLIAVWQPLGSVDLNALKGPTYDPSQDPVQYANDKNDLLLGARKISDENVYQRYYPADQTQIKPPNNPTVNPKMDVIHSSTTSPPM